jgi:uncharacterized protein YbbK (DUF523 family)
MNRNDIPKEERVILSKYNTDQKSAIAKALTTDSFLLVKGSPGCGESQWSFFSK